MRRKRKWIDSSDDDSKLSDGSLQYIQEKVLVHYNIIHIEQWLKMVKDMVLLDKKMEERT